MKTLVIVTHPNMEKSRINKRWIQELKQYPERYTVHDLYACYPDETIDIGKEQKLVESHGTVIFQFPIHWSNCPHLLKKWFDQVLIRGWAYGAGGDAFKGRKVALAVSGGTRKADYSATGKYRYTLQQLFAPFEVTFLYIKAEYRSFFAFCGVEDAVDPALLEKSARDYIAFLNMI